MCGNGARCIAMFAYKNGIIKDKDFILEAVDDLYKAHIINDTDVKIIFPEPKEIRTDIDIKAEFGEGLKDLNINYANVGSDHIIIFLDDKKNQIALDDKSIVELDVNYIGKILRYHNEFQPRGANVNFVVPISENEIRVRTYERGVERETLACGTGIIASGIISAILNKVAAPVRVLAQSGEWLIVDFNLNNDKILNLSLTGSAKKISNGELDNVL
jgi:diaminopimelate epimerase